VELREHHRYVLARAAASSRGTGSFHRDPNWGLPARPVTTDRLLHMLAVDHGRVWNASRIGRSLGISYHSVNDYLDYLVGAFLIRRLLPFHRNVGKRLSKRPKLFWRDSGLFHSLLGATDRASLLRRPEVGASWEGFVIEQILGTLEADGRGYEAYYFQTSDQREIDLVLELGGERWALEIKLIASPSPADSRRLDANADLIDAERRFLVCQVPQSLGDDQRGVTGLDELLALLSRPRS
jgi:predicted AAA+ superfamily ATPase